MRDLVDVSSAEERVTDVTGQAVAMRHAWRGGLRFAVMSVLTMVLGVAGALAQGGVDGVVPPPIFDEQPIGQTPPPSEIQPITNVVPLWGDDVARPRDGSAAAVRPRRDLHLHRPEHRGVRRPDQGPATRPVTSRTRRRLRIPSSFAPMSGCCPFLNVYGLLGYTAGKTEAEIRLPNGTSIGRHRQLQPRDVRRRRDAGRRLQGVLPHPRRELHDRRDPSGQRADRRSRPLFDHVHPSRGRHLQLGPLGAGQPVDRRHVHGLRAGGPGSSTLPLRTRAADPAARTTSRTASASRPKIRGTCCSAAIGS